MNDYSEILNRHGYRNSGDNLTGFRIDIDHILEDSGLFEWVELKEASSLDCMVTAVCKAKESSDLIKLQKDIERIWMDFLRYPSFEKHRFEKTDAGFLLHFVTTSTNLGIVGVIECRK